MIKNYSYKIILPIQINKMEIYTKLNKYLYVIILFLWDIPQHSLSLQNSICHNHYYPSQYTHSNYHNHKNYRYNLKFYYHPLYNQYIFYYYHNNFHIHCYILCIFHGHHITQFYICNQKKDVYLHHRILNKCYFNSYLLYMC